MRRLVSAIYAALFVVIASTCLHAADTWDVQADIQRLSKEVPSLALFSDAGGVVWRSASYYDMMADGTRRHRNRSIMVLADDAPDALLTRVLPHPAGAETDLRVELAEWYDAKTFERIGTLDTKVVADDGIKRTVISIPERAKGELVVISYTETDPLQFYLDDVVPLTAPIPIWEYSITVDISDGMNIYWEGSGVLSPIRTREDSGVERVEWVVRNQPAWHDSSLMAKQPPMLVFSLRRGLDTNLRTLAEMEERMRAPSIPSSVASVRSSQSSLAKIGSAIHEYLRSRIYDDADAGARQLRASEMLLGDVSWTPWEATLIAAKWFESMGFGVRTFWSQRTPIGASGPASMALWDVPVLIVTSQNGSDEFYYTASQTQDFGKVAPELYGRTIYRIADNELERLTVPKGVVTDHQLVQNWRMTMSESGEATGKVDMTVTGEWIKLLGLHSSATSEDVARVIHDKFAITLPAFAISDCSLKRSAGSVRISMEIQAKLGIASGSDILVRLPGGMPGDFAELQKDVGDMAFRFPFIIEQNAVITTPPGYRALMLPGRVKAGDSKASFESNIEHWPKKRWIEAQSKWTVRQLAFDDAAAKTVTDQCRSAVMWSVSPLPFRK